jgi:hypothetical protein
MPNYNFLPVEMYDAIVEDFGPWHAQCYLDKLQDASMSVGGVEDGIIAALLTNPKTFVAPVYNLSLSVN